MLRFVKHVAAHEFLPPSLKIASRRNIDYLTWISWKLWCDFFPDSFPNNVYWKFPNNVYWKLKYKLDTLTTTLATLATADNTHHEILLPVKLLNGRILWVKLCHNHNILFRNGKIQMWLMLWGWLCSRMLWSRKILPKKPHVNSLLAHSEWYYITHQINHSKVGDITSPAPLSPKSMS